MKKLVKSYREMIDSTEKRPEFLLGLIFGLIVAMVGFIAMIELGGLWIDAPRPSDLASRLLGVGRLSLSAIAGVSLGMLIAGLVTTWAWHALKRDSEFRVKYPDWRPDDA